MRVNKPTPTEIPTIFGPATRQSQGNAATAPRSAPVASGCCPDAPMRNTIARKRPGASPEDQRPGQRGQRQELRCCVATEGHLQCIDEARIGGECDTSPDRRRGPTRQTVHGRLPGSATTMPQRHPPARSCRRTIRSSTSADREGATATRGRTHAHRACPPSGLGTNGMPPSRTASAARYAQAHHCPSPHCRPPQAGRRPRARSRPAAPGSGGRHLGGAPLHHASLRTRLSAVRAFPRPHPWPSRQSQWRGPARSAAAQMPPTSRPPGSRVHGSAAGRCR